MQRRPSKREQHTPVSQSGDVHAELENKAKDREKNKPRDALVAAPSRVSVWLCVLPFLAIVALFVRFYYDTYHGSHFSGLLYNYASSSSSSSSSLNIDNRINENGQLRPEDHVYREATKQTLDWSVTAAYRRPDGVDKKVYLINSEYLTSKTFENPYSLAG